MNPALVLCSHGTADAAGQEVIRRTAAAIRHAAAPFEVHEAVVDVEQHRLDAVLAGLHRPAVIVPLLLSRGFHVRHDIAAAVRAHPGPAVVAAPLGPDAVFAEIAVRRLREAGATNDDVVILGASGSSDQAALDDVAVAAHLLAARWGGPVRVGHLGQFGDPLGQAIAAARRGDRRVAVASYLVAPGHFQRVLAASGADLVTDPLLSPSPEPSVVDLVISRFERAARRLTWAPPPARVAPWST